MHHCAELAFLSHTFAAFRTPHRHGRLEAKLDLLLERIPGKRIGSRDGDATRPALSLATQVT